ncbi:hypothetical protein ACVWZ6_002752 [Bradyrhizobium sp. GM6.1]
MRTHLKLPRDFNNVDPSTSFSRLVGKPLQPNLFHRAGRVQKDACLDIVLFADVPDSWKKIFTGLKSSVDDLLDLPAECLPFHATSPDD